MQARAWKIHRLALIPAACLVGMDAIEPDAVRLLAIRLIVRQRRGMATRVPFLAIHRASVAADTSIEIDDKAEFFGSRQGVGNAGHCDVFPLLAPKRRRLGWSGAKGGSIAAGCGAVSSSVSGSQRAMFTVRSNQAAWPVTGSLFDRSLPSPSAGRYSEIKWLSRKPVRDSGASLSSVQAPERLPIAFLF